MRVQRPPWRAHSIIHGSVMHRRLRPARHQFVYSAFSLVLPLSRIAELPAQGIAWNRRGLVSFFDRDHGERDGSALEPWIRKLLASEGVGADGEIVLHAFPRMLGYVFNPVSFWVCHDRDGGVRAVLCEVCNTFGEQHNYLLAHPDGRPLVSGETLQRAKGVPRLAVLRSQGRLPLPVSFLRRALACAHRLRR